MAQDQLDLTPQDTLALSAAMRRPLTDLFSKHCPAKVCTYTIWK